MEKRATEELIKRTWGAGRGGEKCSKGEDRLKKKKEARTVAPLKTSENITVAEDEERGI